MTNCPPVVGVLNQVERQTAREVQDLYRAEVDELVNMDGMLMLDDGVKDGLVQLAYADAPRQVAVELELYRMTCNGQTTSYRLVRVDYHYA